MRRWGREIEGERKREIEGGLVCFGLFWFVVEWTTFFVPVYFLGGEKSARIGGQKILLEAGIGIGIGI